METQEIVPTIQEGKQRRAYAVWILLMLAIIVRIVHSLISDRMIYPDEHFQSLEPATWAVSRIGWLSWEWQLGARNWLVPGVFMPLLYGLKLFGITGGSFAIAACRILVAVGSVLAMFRFNQLLERRALVEGQRLLALAAYALYPPMIVWGVTSLTENLASIALWSSLPFLYDTAMKKSRAGSRFFLCGLWLGLTMALRYQMVLWVGPLLLVWAGLFRPSLRHAMFGLLGLVTVAAALGGLDELTWGQAFQSAIVYLKVNVQEGFVNQHGTLPWYAYIVLLLDQFHLWLWLPVLFMFVWKIAKRSLVLQKIDAFILLPGLAFVTFHAMLAHKELRFISPFFPAFFYILALVAGPLANRWQSLKRKRFIALLSLGLALITVAASVLAERKSYYMPYDLNESAQYIARRDLFSQPDSPCLAFYQSYAVWTRGEMLLNAHVRQVQVDTNQDDQTWRECRAALVYRGWLDSFQTLAGDRWKLAYRSTDGDGVFVVE